MVLLLSFGKQQGDYPFSKWDTATTEKANSAKNISYLSNEEKKIVYYVNLVRLNPELFAKTYFQKYMDSTKTKLTTFSRSLQHDLTAIYKPMNILTPKQDLAEEALDHAKDLVKSDKTGHFTSDGKSYNFRMKKFKDIYSSVVEDCSYEHQKPLSVVINLLINEGQGSIEYRKNILDKKLKYIGASVQPYKKGKGICVIDFAK